jgi:hypothetical protein
MSEPILCQHAYAAAIDAGHALLDEAVRADQCGAAMWASKYRAAAKDEYRRAKEIKDELKGTPYEIT